MSRTIRAGDKFVFPESKLSINKPLSPNCLLGLHEGTTFVLKVLRPVEIVFQRNDAFPNSTSDCDAFDVFLFDKKGLSRVGIESADNLSTIIKHGVQKQILFSNPVVNCISSEDYESILEDAGGMLYGRRCKAPSPKKSSVKIVRKPVRKPAVNELSQFDPILS